MATNAPAPEVPQHQEEIPPPRPFYREIPAAIFDQLRVIINHESPSADATTQGLFEGFRALAIAIDQAPVAAPAWRVDDLEEQLADARRIANRLATLENPPAAPQPRLERVPDPAMFDGTRDKLEGFVAQLRLKLYSDPTRFPTPALRMAYAFNRLEGRAQAQILPYIQNNTILLTDADALITILDNAFGDPDPAATARTKLHHLKQGNKDFTSYFSEFQMLVSKLNWDERAKLDALREGVSIELHRQLVGRTQGLTYNQFVALCQSLDSELRALQLREGRRNTPRTNNNSSQPQTQPRTTTQNLVPHSTNTTAAPPGPMDLSSNSRKISEQERAARLREGRCLYCGGSGHMARHCPNKNRNPFRAAAAQLETAQAETPPPDQHRLNTPDHPYHNCNQNCGEHSQQSGKA